MSAVCFTQEAANLPEAHSSNDGYPGTSGAAAHGVLQLLEHSVHDHWSWLEDLLALHHLLRGASFRLPDMQHSDGLFRCAFQRTCAEYSDGVEAPVARSELTATLVREVRVSLKPHLHRAEGLTVRGVCWSPSWWAEGPGWARIVVWDPSQFIELHFKETGEHPVIQLCDREFVYVPPGKPQRILAAGTPEFNVKLAAFAVSLAKAASLASEFLQAGGADRDGFKPRLTTEECLRSIRFLRGDNMVVSLGVCGPSAFFGVYVNGLTGSVSFEST